jgi:glycosyltransferase involved in cell wall biosynthesis
MSSLRFSIVIPNFNSGPLLERAIRSLLAQGFPNLQLILMDACSTDQSRETIEQYRAHFDAVIIEKDRGQADALNKGFRQADGDIFGWLCADDELLPGALAHAAALFAQDPAIGIVTGDCRRIFSDGSTGIVPADDQPWKKIAIQNVIEQPATFWRADLHRRAGELDASLVLAFDWDLWNRLRLCRAVIRPTHELLANYYFSDTNKSGNAGRRHASEAFRIVRRYGPLGGGLAHIFRFLYFQFDLKGCYDNPPTCGLLRSHLFIWTLAFLRTLIGRRLLYLYNWHFASCQERGVKWW